MEAEAATVGGNQKQKRIVIVEDDKFLRDLISQKLSREGFFVHAAENGEDGEKFIYEDAPDIILLDIILPGMDGFEVLERIKKNEKVKNIPVLVLSNLSQKSDIDRAKELGAEDFMVKSNFTPEEISKKIQDILMRKYL